MSYKRPRTISDCPVCGYDTSGDVEDIVINGFTFRMCYKCREAYRGWKKWNKILIGIAGRKGKPHCGMSYRNPKGPGLQGYISNE